MELEVLKEIDSEVQGLGAWNGPTVEHVAKASSTYFVLCGEQAKQR
jgi:hypothetical protein